MIDRVKYFARLSTLAVLTLVKLYAVAMFSSVASLVAVLIILIQHAPGAAPHASGAAALLVLVATRPWHCILALLIIACGFLLVFLAGRYAIGTVTNRILTDKSESVLIPLMDRVIVQFRSNRPAVMDKAAMMAWSKMKLVQEVRNESSNRWVRRVLVYAFRKARLDDIDFGQEGTRTSEVVRDRALQALHEMSKPDPSLFRIVIAVQWLAVVASYLL